MVVQRFKDKALRLQGLNVKEVEIQREYSLREAPEYDPVEDIIKEFSLCKGDKRFVGKVPQGHKARRELVETCRKCPVKDACLDLGHRMDVMIAGVSREGLWVGACIYGGKTPLERARIRKERELEGPETLEGLEVSEMREGVPLSIARPSS